MSAARRLLWPGLSTVLMLLVLVSLGAWQVRRLAWKQGILAQIARAEALPAIPLPPDPAPFTKVRIAGSFAGDRWGLYGAEVRDGRQGPVLGGQLVGVLDRADAAPVLVMLGWVPNNALHPPAGPAVVEGFIRPAEHPGLFAANDNPAAKLFYTLDPAAIGAALGRPEVAGFTLVALGPTRPGPPSPGPPSPGPPSPGAPDPAHALPRPPNDHFVYAVTWFSFAGILLVIFGLHVKKVLRP